MNIRSIELEMRRYRTHKEDLEEVKAELQELKSYEKPKRGQGKKNDVPDLADAVAAREYRLKRLQAEEKEIRQRKTNVEAALKLFKGHEYIEAVKRIYINGESVRVVAKDMKRDWRTVDRHAKQLLCQIGAKIPGVGIL